MTLADLRPRQKAIITTIGEIGDLRTRLMDLGISCGEEVQLLRFAPLGDPVEFRIGDEMVSLRLEDAVKIDVEPISQLHGRKRSGVNRSIV